MLGTVTDRRLPVSNLGSSGEDGVEVQLGTVRGGGVTVDLAPLFSTTPDQKSVTFTITNTGTAPTGTLTVHRTTGPTQLECDFSPLGATLIVVRCVDAAGNVVLDTAVASSSVQWTNLSLGGPGAPPVCSMSGGKVSFSDLSMMMTVRHGAPCDLEVQTVAGPVFCPNVAGISLRPIVCITAPCPGDWTSLGSIAANAPPVLAPFQICF